MLPIRNKQQLTENGVLIPVIEQLALCVSGGTSIRMLEAAESTALEMSGWLVYKDAASRGIAFHSDRFAPAATALRRTVSFVQYAQRIVSGFSGLDGFPLNLDESQICPVDWRIFRAHVRSGSFLCGISLPPPVISFNGIHVARGVPNVRVPFIGSISWSGDLRVGESIVATSFGIECPGQQVKGELFLSEGGVMTIKPLAESQVEGQEPPASAAREAILRLDIGEIQLSLSELLALRNGSEILLHSQLPIKCFMRVGTTTVAEGELDVAENGVKLTVREVLS
jgi:hypothetical protein